MNPAVSPATGPIAIRAAARASAARAATARDGRYAGRHRRERSRPVPLILLVASSVLSGTGNGVAAVAVPWLVLERTGSASGAGYVAAATAVPLLFASLLSGTVVDRFGRRRISLLSDGLSACSVAAIPLVDSTVGLPVVGLAALACLGACFDPAGITARESMLPAATVAAGWRPDRANSVYEAGVGISYLLGPGIGGLAVGTVGAAPSLWVTAAGFVLSIALMAAVRLPGLRAEHRRTSPAGRPAGAGAPVMGDPLPGNPGRGDSLLGNPGRGDGAGDLRLGSGVPAGFWQATAEGLAFVWHDRLLRAVGLVSMVAFAVYLPVEGVVLPAYFTARDQPAQLGSVLTAMGLGGIAGTLAFGLLSARVRRRTAFVGAINGVGLCLLGLATLPPLPVMLCLAALLGVCYGPLAPLTNHAMQTRAPDRLRGRVIGVMTSSAYAVGPAGYLLAGPLVDHAGIRPAFLLLAGALAVCALATIPLRALHDFDADPADATVASSATEAAVARGRESAGGAAAAAASGTTLRGQDSGRDRHQAKSVGGLAEPAGEVVVQVLLIVADPGDVAVGA
jgi:MFS family permease